MPAIKRRKIFQSSAKHPQEYLSKFSRIGSVQFVDVINGVCRIKWLDNPGGRNDVYISQSSWGEFNMPIVGSIVFVECDAHDQARIVRYANLNQVTRQQLPNEGGSGEIPKVQPGEKYWESVGGAYIYMTEGGRIFLVSPGNDSIEIDPDLNLIRSESVNWKVITDAGTDWSGEVRRWLPGKGNVVITDNTPTLQFPNGTPLTERIIVVGDFSSKYKSNGTTLIKINIGTYVDNLGNVVDITGIPVLPTSTSALAIRLQVIPSDSSTGLVLAVDKAGKCSITTPNLTVNSSNIVLGDVSATEPGVLGQTLATLLSTIISTFNSHTHSSGTLINSGGPVSGLSGGPSSSISDTSANVKAKNVKLI